MPHKTIDWDKLETTKIEKEIKFRTTRLRVGRFRCPACNGEGKTIFVYGSPPEGNRYGTCAVCCGSGVIKKCSICRINPVPMGSPLGESEACDDCNRAMRQLGMPKGKLPSQRPDDSALQYQKEEE